jgi:hypothetical protein
MDKFNFYEVEIKNNTILFKRASLFYSETEYCGKFALPTRQNTEYKNQQKHKKQL